MNNTNSLHNVTLYGKEGCHLCENAREALLTMASELDINIELDEIDIRSDPTLFEKYKYTIPVMIIDRSIKLECPIYEKALYRALTEGYGPKFEV